MNAHCMAELFEGARSGLLCAISSWGSQDARRALPQVSHPPQLPVVSDERLLGAWPLGEMTFSIFVCPITHSVMTDPVVSADGHTYERAAIARWRSSKHVVRRTVRY